MPTDKHLTDAAAKWTPAELATLDTLTSPAAIQRFLDDVEYSADPFYRSPRSVMRDGKAHCADGALFAAAALRRLGHPPLIMELRAVRDDDHLLAVYRHNGRIGAMAKSNFTGLRSREPIFRNLRELALSYFESYFNLELEKTLRAFSVTLDLAHFDHLNWYCTDDHIEQIMDRLDRVRHYPLVTETMASDFSSVDQRTYDAGTIGVNWDGVYRGPKEV